jgi:hypothetical protein
MGIVFHVIAVAPIVAPIVTPIIAPIVTSIVDKNDAGWRIFYGSVATATNSTTSFDY